MKESMSRVLLAVGSNLGDRVAHLNEALDRLAHSPDIRLEAQSDWTETIPAGGSSGALYLNGAVVVETSLSPAALLARLQLIEADLGRRRETRWGPRTLDLDLLLFDDQELETPPLTIPHPRMAFRRFVLEPACQIAADWIYPINGWSLKRLLTHLNDTPKRLAVYTESQAIEELRKEIQSEHPTWEFVSGWPDQNKPVRLILVCPSLTIVQEELNNLNVRRRRADAPPVLWLPGISPEQLRQEAMAALVAME